MSVVIGTLVIDLKAGTASFSQSMDKMASLSAKTATDIKRSLDKIAIAGAALASSIATGAAVMISKNVEAIVSLEHFAQAAGTTVDKLSLLAAAGRRVDVPVETIAKGLEKLSKAAFGAQNGNEQLANVFQKLTGGVDDSNGHLRSSTDLFNAIAVKFAGMADGAGKTALAIQLFGRAGAGMIPLLNDWGLHQAELTETYRKFGLMIGPEIASKAEKYKQTLGTLKAALSGLSLQITAAALPALQHLADRIADIAKSIDIPKLASQFGSVLVTGVNLFANTLQFAAQHAHALKLALEGIAAIKFASIAIPLLSTANWAAATTGIQRFVLSGLGIQKLVPILGQAANWLKTEAFMVASLAGEEGIASAASYGLGAAISAIGGPVTLAIGAIVGLGATLYAFRDTVFKFEGETYRMRDIWSAVWIEMETPIKWLGDKFSSMVSWMAEKWSQFSHFLSSAFISALSAISPLLAAAGTAILPGFDKALAEAKRRRLASGAAAPGETAPPHLLPPPDTAGFGPEKKDVYGEALAKLNEAIVAQTRFLSVLHGTPDAIEAVNSAMKAEAEILKLNIERQDAHLPKLTAQQEATIRQRVALEGSLSVINAYGKELVGQTQASELATIQARNLARAVLEGDAAVDQAVLENEILARTWGKSESALKALRGEIDALRTALQAQADAAKIEAANRETKQITDEIAARKDMVAAIFGGSDAMREAALTAKVYALDQQILAATDSQVREALEKKKAAIVALTHAEWDEQDAEKALELFSPVERLQRELDSLRSATEALRKLDDGTLTYAHALELAAKQQELFDRAIDETVNLLLRENNAGAGVTAFFLEMQKQAKTTAAIVYDSLKSAFDKLADNLTALATHGKTEWAKMFQDIGRQMVNNAIKSSLQQGIGAIGKALGVNLGGVLGGKPDGSSEAKALWVRMTGGGLFGGGSGSSSGGGSGSGGSTGSSGASGGGLASIGKLGGALGGIFSRIAGAAGGLFGGFGKIFGGLFSHLFAGGFAEGGYVSPGMMYIAGERGPEPIFSGSTGNTVMSNAAAQRTFGGGGFTHAGAIYVDARGGGPGTELAVYRGIRAAHDSAVSTAARTMQERAQRIPHR